MKSRYTYYFLMSVLPFTFSGCAVSDRAKKVTVNPVETLTPDSTSCVDIDDMNLIFSPESKVCLARFEEGNLNVVSEAVAQVTDDGEFFVGWCELWHGASSFLLQVDVCKNQPACKETAGWLS